MLERQAVPARAGLASVGTVDPGDPGVTPARYVTPADTAAQVEEDATARGAARVVNAATATT